MKYKLLIFLTIFLLSISSNIVSAKSVCLLSENLDEIKCSREIYLQNNISNIANDEGIELNEDKKFYINSIDWISRDSVLVEFEDGNRIYLALIDFDSSTNDIKYVQMFEPGVIDTLVLKDSITVHKTQGFLKDVYAKIRDWFSKFRN